MSWLEGEGRGGEGVLWSRECENVRSRANELKIFIALKKPAEVPHINLLVVPYLKMFKYRWFVCLAVHLSTFSLDNLSQSPSEAIIITSSSVSLLFDKSNFRTCTRKSVTFSTEHLSEASGGWTSLRLRCKNTSITVCLCVCLFDCLKVEICQQYQ